MIFYPFWPPYSRKFRFSTFDRKTGNSWRKISPVQSFEVPGWHSAECRVPLWRFETLHQFYVKFLSRNFSHFGRLTAENSDSVLLTSKRENRGEKTPLVQSSEVPGWHPALCRMPHRHVATLYQWCVKFISRISYLFWPPYSRKFRFRYF